MSEVKKYCEFQTPCGMCKIQSQFFGYRCPYWNDDRPIVKLDEKEKKNENNR